MKEKEKVLIGIGLGIGGIVLAILAMTGYFRSEVDQPTTIESITNENQTVQSPAVIADSSTQDSLLEEILDEEKTDASITESTEAAVDLDVDNAYIEWQQMDQYEKEIKKVNDQFLAAFYGNLEPKERNAQLKQFVTEAIYEEEELPESGQVIQPFIEELEIETAIQSVDRIQGSIINVVSMKVDNVPQKMLVTISFINSDDWLIDQLTFESILTNGN